MDITPQQATEFTHATIPAIGRMGVRVEKIGPGSVELVVPIEGNGNHFGTMYAGALFSLVEMPGGFLPLSVLGPQFTPIVTRVDIRFMAAARTDVRLKAEIEPDELQRLAERATAEGKAEFTLDLSGQDADGRTVVECTAYYQLRPSR
jgi:acyl-coenzyme A thioesterase PaaI-like protein